MSMIDKESLIDYYRGVKQDNLDEYTVEDYYTILTTPCYNELPRSVTKALFNILVVYLREFTGIPNKKGDFKRSRDEVVITMIPETENPLNYKVILTVIKRDIPLHQLDTHTYKNIIERFIRISSEDYFTYNKASMGTFGAVGKRPLRWYQDKMEDLTKIGLYYLGEEETVRIFEESNNAFFKQIRESDWGKTFHDREIQHTERLIKNKYIQQKAELQG